MSPAHKVKLLTRPVISVANPTKSLIGPTASPSESRALVLNGNLRSIQLGKVVPALIVFGQVSDGQRSAGSHGRR